VVFIVYSKAIGARGYTRQEPPFLYLQYQSVPKRTDIAYCPSKQKGQISVVCNSSPFKQRFDITIIEQMDKTGTLVAKTILIGRLMTDFWQCNCLLTDSWGIPRSRDFLGLNSANQQDS